MARTNRQTNRTGKNGRVTKDSQAGKDSSKKKLSCALQVLRDGLRTIDHAADLVQAALIDMEIGTSQTSKTSQHLNGVGKILQMKKMKDNAVDSLKKTSKKDAGKLPGTGRKFA